MNELRWILLAAGLLLIAGIYVLGTRARRQSAPPAERTVRVDSPPPAPAPEAPRVEPRLSVHDAFESTATVTEHTIDFDEPAFTRASPNRREPTLGTEAPLVVQRTQPEEPAEPRLEPPPEPAAPAPEPAPPPEARPQQKIVAVRVVAAPPLRFEGARLLEVIQSEELQFGRYEIFHNLHPDGRPVFSLASLREPGTFDLGAMPGTSYPGIALFAVLPGPLPAVETFDQLIFTARAFAAQLGGTLADERGAPLTVHRITRLREEMVAFDRPLAGDADG